MYNILKEDLKNAMKEKNNTVKNSIKNVINKAQSIAKDEKVEIDDNIVYKAAQKELAQLKDTLSYCTKGTDKYNECVTSINVVSKYLPKMATVEEINKYLEEIKPDNIGEAMKALKQKFGSALDGKEASKIVKEYLLRS